MKERTEVFLAHDEEGGLEKSLTDRTDWGQKRERIITINILDELDWVDDGNRFRIN